MEAPDKPELHRAIPPLNRVRAAFGRWAGINSVTSHWIRRHRLVFCLVLCAGLSVLSWTVAFIVRFELSSILEPAVFWHDWWLRTLTIVVGLRLVAFILLGLHRVSWQYAAARDIFPILGAVLASSVVIVPTVLLMWQGAFPRSVFVIDTLICLILLAGARYSYRLGDEILASLGAGKRKKALVIGAGAAGNLTVRAMLSSKLAEYWPVALLDDDPLKLGTTIQGVPVVGQIESVEKIARRTGATAIVLALPMASSQEIYRILALCRPTGLPLKTIPDYGQIMRSSNVVTRLHSFSVNDLLHRRPVRADVPEIKAFLRGHAVLVTGAAGSIGSELCRQITEQGDARSLICMDKDENGLFRLEHRLRELGGLTELAFFLGDIKDRRRMDFLFESYGPDMVFHAAAYKHVPILQHHPVEAVRNNVGGTRTLVDLADRHDVGTFVLISTDKAVNPTSVMGATKRIAELIVRTRDLTSKTSFCTIRFGNVLGSNGSVVELFMHQIREGRPVTVTHPDIERYFMTIPEAVHLVLFAATMGEGGEVFILDMGEPVKIDQLARQMIQLSGLTPDVDVPITYTGLRPGEKLYEDLWAEQEDPQATSHSGIRVARRRDRPLPDITEMVTTLLKAGEENDLSGCWKGILGLVPTFQGQTGEERASSQSESLAP